MKELTLCVLAFLVALALVALVFGVIQATAEDAGDSAKCDTNPRRYLDVYEVHTENLICGVAQCGLRVKGFSCVLVPVEELP